MKKITSSAWIRRCLLCSWALVCILSLGFGSFASGINDLYLNGYIRVDSYYGALQNLNGVLIRENLANLLHEILRKADKTEPNLQGLTFADVDLITEAFRPDVAYCVQNGLLQGVGNNLFDPMGEVNGVQLGAIMLRVLGYGDVPWNNVEGKLRELGIPAENRVYRVDQTLDYIWNALSKGIAREGSLLFQKELLTEQTTEENLFVYFDQGRYGLRTADGKILVAPKYDYISTFFSDGIACVALDKKWGYIDKQGKPLN